LPMKPNPFENQKGSLVSKAAQIRHSFRAAFCSEENFHNLPVPFIKQPPKGIRSNQADSRENKSYLKIPGNVYFHSIQGEHYNLSKKSEPISNQDVGP